MLFSDQIKYKTCKVLGEMEGEEQVDIAVIDKVRGDMQDSVLKISQIEQQNY